MITEGRFTPFQSVRDFFKNKRISSDSQKIFIRTIGFSGRVYKILGSDMPLGSHKTKMNNSLNFDCK